MDNKGIYLLEDDPGNAFAENILAGKRCLQQFYWKFLFMYWNECLMSFDIFSSRILVRVEIIICVFTLNL